MGIFDTSGDVSPEFFEETGNEAQGAEIQSNNVDDGRNPDLDQAGQGLDQNGLNPPEQGNGELILGKYKSQEDLVRAHEALQKRFGDMRNEVGQLRQQNTNQPDQSQQEETQQWTDEQWKQFDQEFQQEFMQNPGKAVFNLVNDVLQQAMAPLQESINGQTVNQEYENAVTGELSLMLNAINDAGQLIFPGAAEMAGEIDAFLESNPYFFDILASQANQRSQGQMDEGTMGVLDVIYKAVQADTALKAGQQAYQNGLQQGQRSAQNKNQARLPNAGAKQNNAVSPEDQIADEIVSVRRGGLFK